MNHFYNGILSKFSQDGKIQYRDILERMEQGFQQNGYRAHQEGPQRILVIRLDEIGDNVLSSAFMRELRRNFPQAEIDLLVNPTVYPLMELCPYVNRVLAAEGLPKDRIVDEFLYWMGGVCEKTLWARHYDLCFVPRWDSDTSYAVLLSFLCGARKRIGFSEHVYPVKEELDRGEDAFLTHVVMTPPYLVHEVEKNLFLLKECGFHVESDAIELWLSQSDMDHAKHLLTIDIVGGYIAVAVGTREGRKTYPSERLAEALRLLLPIGLSFVLLGGPGEENDAAVVERQLPEERVLNLVGKIPLRVSAALVALSRLYLGGDTGLTHIAAAAKRPMVEWFCHAADIPVSTLSPLVRFSPWQAPAAIIRPARALDGCSNFTVGFAELAGCQSAHDAHCIKTIAPKSIADAARVMLK